MDQVVTNWLDQIANQKLDNDDVERSLRYAKDLEQGLAKIRTFAQGVTIFGSARLKENDKWCKESEKLGFSSLRLFRRRHRLRRGLCLLPWRLRHT